MSNQKNGPAGIDGKEVYERVARTLENCAHFNAHTVEAAIDAVIDVARDVAPGVGDYELITMFVRRLAGEPYPTRNDD